MAAAMVVISHAYMLVGAAGFSLHARDRKVALGTLGVLIFFSVSGYLISAAWLHRPQVAYFAIHRAFRIWPALCAMVVLLAFVVGPLVTTSPEYWQNPTTWSFVWRNMLIVPFQQTLPGVFEWSRTPEANGTLWSLSAEVLCYFAVVALGLMGLLEKHRRFFFIGLGILILATIALGCDHGSTSDRALCLSAFMSGTGLNLFGMRRPNARAAVAAVFVMTGMELSGAFPSGAFVPLIAFCSISLGVSSQSWAARTLERTGDPSYGMYIYGFPAQQCLLGASPTLTHRPMLYAILSLLLAAMSGLLSWHLIEARALRRGRSLASKLPRRASDHRRDEAYRPKSGPV